MADNCKTKELGPVHFWMYQKILLQEDLTKALEQLAEEKNWPEVKENNLGAVCTDCDRSPLEEVVDGDNIHGWISDRIGDAESRYAMLVTGLLQGDASRLSDLEACARAFGVKHRLETGAPAADAYQKFEDVFLNGMPCDRVNVVTDEEEDRIAWEQTSDKHASFWEAVGGNPVIYYDLRDNVMEGLLENTGWQVVSPKLNHYEIRKR